LRLPALDTELLRAHDRTVRRLGTLAAGVLPFRCGQVVADEAALSRLIAPRVEQPGAAGSGVRAYAVAVQGVDVADGAAAAVGLDAQGTQLGG
jgi:hypothetical protein